MQRNYRFRPRAVAVRGPTDVTAPTLTFPVALPLGDTTAYLQVATDEGNGTLYYVITTSVTPPSAAQVLAGQDNTGAAAPYANNQPVTTTGTQIATPTPSGVVSNTVYFGYFVQVDAAGNQSAVKAQTTFTTLTTGTSDTSFDTLIAAMSVPPTDLRKGYIAQCIQQLYAGGLWAKIDILYVMAAHDEQAGRLNWITPASFTLSAVNSPTFTTDRGFNGNGSSSYLDTTWDPATNGVQYARDSAHLSVYGGATAGTGVLFGSRTAVNPSIYSSTSQSNTRVNNTTNLAVVAGVTFPVFVFSRRPDASTVTLFKDAVQIGNNGALASAALTNVDLSVCRSQNTAYTTGRHIAASAGATMDDTEQAALFSTLRAYMIAVGAAT